MPPDTSKPGRIIRWCPVWVEPTGDPSPGLSALSWSSAQRTSGRAHGERLRDFLSQTEPEEDLESKPALYLLSREGQWKMLLGQCLWDR